MVFCRDLQSSFSARQRGSRFAHKVLLAILVLSSGAAAQRAASSSVAVSQNLSWNGDSVATDLAKGIDLTRQGEFRRAIPLLQRARTGTANIYAGSFNLSLCYLGVGDFKQAIMTLEELYGSGYNTAAMNNLLAQAYIGDGQPDRAFQALEEASRQTPKDEKLYAFVADACTDHYAYNLGLRVVDLGLQRLPDSARLHYERAVFLARLDRLEEAKPEFQLSSKLAPGSDIGYMALIQEKLYEEQYGEALALAREGIGSGHRDYQMLSLLGTILMHSGVAPGQRGFAEAQEALEESVAANPMFSTSQIALGKLYLMEGKSKDAVAHLEIGRRLEPRNPAVYTSLARAYREIGEREKAQESIAALSALLREKSATGNSPPP